MSTHSLTPETRTLTNARKLSYTQTHTLQCMEFDQPFHWSEFMFYFAFFLPFKRHLILVLCLNNCLASVRKCRSLRWCNEQFLYITTISIRWPISSWIFSACISKYQHHICLLLLSISYTVLASPTGVCVRITDWFLAAEQQKNAGFFSAENRECVQWKKSN